jgi:poly(3-hydroxybutyrate) depolymerase
MNLKGSRMKTAYFFIAIVLSSSILAEWKTESFKNSNVLYFNPTNSKNEKVGLMLHLHGCAQVPEDVKKDGNWESAANQFNLLVLVPKVPNGGKYFGCWDYYGSDHTRTNRDNGFLIELVNYFIKNSTYNIDPNKVFVTGLSSGGGEAFVLACLAPDIFKGVGINAGPMIGSSVAEIANPNKNIEGSIDTCKKLASDNNVLNEFQTQKVSIIYGNNDNIVNTVHDLNNAEVFSALYNSNIKSIFDPNVFEGAHSNGKGVMYSDGKRERISLIMNENLGHNWPSGQGGTGGKFINKQSLNYPMYLAKFFQN